MNVADPREPEIARIRMVSESRQVFGNATAAQLWFKLGLPIVPAMLQEAAQPDLFYDRVKPNPVTEARDAA